MSGYTTSEKANFALTTLVVRGSSLSRTKLLMQLILHMCSSDPITSVVPTKDGSTYLIGTLDSSIRLLDSTNGTVLNTFKGHVNDSYRTRACFGHGEATVIAGDENGQVWCWDLVTVSTVLLLSRNVRSNVMRTL